MVCGSNATQTSIMRCNSRKRSRWFVDYSFVSLPVSVPTEFSLCLLFLLAATHHFIFFWKFEKKNWLRDGPDCRKNSNQQEPHHLFNPHWEHLINCRFYTLSLYLSSEYVWFFLVGVPAVVPASLKDVGVLWGQGLDACAHTPTDTLAALLLSGTQPLSQKISDNGVLNVKLMRQLQRERRPAEMSTFTLCNQYCQHNGWQARGEMAKELSWKQRSVDQGQGKRAEEGGGTLLCLLLQSNFHPDF